jgi:hypothetical protein
MVSAVIVETTAIKVKLAKIAGRVGFVLGFLGPVLFYTTPAGSPLYESHLVCPVCPYVDGIMPTSGWLQLGLTIGLLTGFGYALLGFGIGYLVWSYKRKAGQIET